MTTTTTTTILLRRYVRPRSLTQFNDIVQQSCNKTLLLTTRHIHSSQSFVTTTPSTRTTNHLLPRRRHTCDQLQSQCWWTTTSSLTCCPFSTSSVSLSSQRVTAFTTSTSAADSDSTSDRCSGHVRLSKLISQYASNMTLSRNQADKLIKDGQVTMYGQVVSSPWTLVDLTEILGSNRRSSSSESKVSSSDASSTTTSSSSSAPVFKVKGKPLFFVDELFSLLPSNDNNDNQTPSGSARTSRSSNVPHVWAVHKLEGEVVSERDPQGRPSLLDRLQSSGVGKIQSSSSSSSKRTAPVHLKPIGRLDMMTEGLLLVTDSGEYAREMELPSSNVHRVYRARVHGRLTVHKLDQIRQGRVSIVHDKDDGDHNGNEDFGIRNRDRGRYGGRRTYAPMKVLVEKTKGKRGATFRTNSWLRITSTDGKNRQIRNVFSALGMTVTRLIRIQYGDYRLESIPRGIAIPVPYKPLDRQKAVGKLKTMTKEQSPASKMSSFTDRRPSTGQRGRRRESHDRQKRPDEQASPVRWVTSVS